MAIENRSAKFNYFLEEFYEAGIVLVGSEVKSVRQGKMTISDSFVKITDGEVFLHNANIAKYDKSTVFTADPKRTRKLLLHKSQIEKISKKVQTAGYAVVPIKVYFSKGYAKVQIAVAKGKKLFNKKQSIKERDNLRQAQRELKNC